MDYRGFDSFDEPTSHNLRRLDHFSKQNYSISRDQLDDFLVAVIVTHKLLPEQIQKNIYIHDCFTCGAHMNMDQERRNKLLSDICAELDSGLVKVLADKSLHLNYKAGVDRPVTSGEKILALCDEFETAYDALAVARKLEIAGAGTEVAWDAKELQRLLRKKRVSNAYTHEAEMQRRFEHIKIIAHRSHHKSG